MYQVSIGSVIVSRLCIGGNPFSGFSHQSEERSREMVAYYTPERIKETLRAAEAAGINTFIGRTDDHITGILRDYWDEGGTIQRIAQITPDRDDPESWRKWLTAAAKLGAVGAYMHGGVVDSWHANRMFAHFEEALHRMRDEGFQAVGFAGHKPEAHAWIRDHLEVDFQMCSHYNPTDRSQHAQHIGAGEKWDDADRAQMLEVISTIEKPVINYKVFAGGNKPVIPAFELLAKVMRRNDAVCVGMFLKDDPQMIAKNVSLTARYLTPPGVA